MSKYGIIGCGAWGTTLGKILAENNHDVSIWCHRKEIETEINQHKTHYKLPNIKLPKKLIATQNLVQLANQSDILINALPSLYLNHLEELSNHPPKPTLSLTKGLNPPPLPLFISDYFAQKFPLHPLAILSGPNLAIEIANHKPTATVIASKNKKFREKLQIDLSNAYFRAYNTSDIKGIEIGGVFKNVIAIAAGCIAGLNLGDNTKATLVTRGLQEMCYLAKFFKVKQETLYGLSGLGDLIATCNSPLSRNWKLGFNIAKGKTLDQIQKTTPILAEGIKTTKIMIQVAKKNNIELPICKKVHEVLFNNTPAKKALQDLMTRKLKEENSC